jgi:putative endonuclease
MKTFYVYILTNKTSTALYVGVTSNLIQRVLQHKQKLAEGFTKKYNVDKLVYYEIYETAEEAIKREKQLKGGSRLKKAELVNKMNIEWKDLYESII